MEGMTSYQLIEDLDRMPALISLVVVFVALLCIGFRRSKL